MNSKLERQLAELLKAEVITADTVQRITAYYDTKDEERPNRLFAIFGVMGALLSGLGIILIIAHNWDDMPRILKTIFAFIPLLIGQIASAFSVLRKKGKAWIESSATFLILSVGATISLISQIYNIPGELSDFLWVWILVTAPLMYVLRSNIALILHLFLMSWYACNLGYFFNSQMPWWYFVFLVWAVPFYLKLLKNRPLSNVTGVLNWLFPLSIVVVLGAFSKGDSLGYIMYIGLFGLLYNIGQLPVFKNQKLRRNGYTIIGSIGTIFISVILTFQWFWKEAARDIPGQTQLMISLLLFIAAIAIVVYVHLKKHIERFNLFQFAFLVVGLLYLTNGLGTLHNQVLMNVLVAVLGLFAIRIGVRKNSYGILNYGLSILTVLIICRFFDTDLDFIFRGILFIAVGLGFFFANYLMLKKQRKTSNNTKTIRHE